MSLGHLTLINIVTEMGADVKSKMNNDLTTMHCAAQTYHGLLSMLILDKRFSVGVNQRDSKKATPLHFAAMYYECKNVELMIRYGADLNA
jgi:ankyrin repeat protein